MSSISDDAKTQVMDTQSLAKVYSNGLCPVCGAELKLCEDTGKLKCPVCGLTKIKCIDFRPGDILRGKYRLLSQLNSGGCGSIFLCYPLDNIQVRYIVKVLKNGDIPELQQRFSREANLLSSMQDEHIVKILDHWSDSSGSFIILEYINGKNLRALREEFEFGEESTLLIAREVASTLQYVWDNYSIIHRDIKPENIMLDQDNNVKLLDFGLSKDTEHSGTDITLDNAGLGTPGYMSPEQFLDFKHVDFRTDIFSLGATMFLLLTGKKTFDGENTQAIYNNTIGNAPPLPETLSPFCSERCVALIRKMMQHDPEKRPASYGELLQTINTLLEG